MAERLVVYFAVAVFSAWHWQQLEQPRIAASEMALIILVALAPALLAAARRFKAAIAAAVAGFVVVVWRAFGYLPWDRGHAVYPVRIGSGIHDGARAWFDTITPFDPVRFAQTDGLVQVAFALLLALFAWLLLDGRFALTAVSAAFALFAIPSTAVGMGDRGLRAAIFLILALAILAVCQRRVPAGASAIAQLAAIGAATVLAGVVVGSAPGVAKGAFFDWRHWNPLASDGPQKSVAFVWNETFGPIHFPKDPVTMFTVSSANPHYWKAGVDTVFNGTSWVQATTTGAQQLHDQIHIRAPSSILPPKAQNATQRDKVQVGIKIQGLADDHLITTGQALQFNVPGQQLNATLTTDGTVLTSEDLPRDATYNSVAYAPNPTVKQLAGAGTAFPADIAEGVVVDNRLIPVWGSGKSVNVPIDRSLVKASDQAWKASGANDPSASEYGAVAALESYFHSKKFHFDWTPPHPKGLVLADFMLHSHRGYCQMFSGSMALVLRLHGIPARVAYGFTQGEETTNGDFKVIDRDAHAWVEVYFPGYGWMPFEPTPTRHLPVLTSTTNSKLLSLIANRQEASKLGIPVKLQRAIGLPSGPATAGKFNKAHGTVTRGQGGGAIAVSGSAGHASFFVWALSATLVVVLIVAGVKLLAVRWRYLRSGPRGQASAAYHEVSTYLGDQGVSVPANATFEELAAILDSTWAVDATQLAAAGSAARYAPPPVAREAGRQVRPALRRVRREMRAALSLRERIFGALRLRSMLAQTTHLE